MKRIICLSLAILLLISQPAFAWKYSNENPYAITEFLALCEDNGILLGDIEPAVVILRSENAKAECDHYFYDIADNYCIIYKEYADRTYMYLKLPYAYRPWRDMYALLLSYMLDIEHDIAAELLDSLEYNVINIESSTKHGDCDLTFLEFYGRHRILTISKPL